VIIRILNPKRSMELKLIKIIYSKEENKMMNITFTIMESIMLRKRMKRKPIVKPYLKIFLITRIKLRKEL